MRYIANEVLRKAVEDFRAVVDSATQELQSKWVARETIDVYNLSLDVLYFRNAEIFGSILFLLDNKYLPASDLLIRPLYEGTIIFEWCLIEPRTRALRFRQQSMKGMIALIDNGYLQRSDDYRKTMEEAVGSLSKAESKNLPNVKQMLEEIDLLNKDNSYNFYSHLSKLTHACFENWGEYICFEDNLKIREPEKRSLHRICSAYIMCIYLQMRNLQLVAQFDEYLQSERIDSLESIWADAYPILKEFGV